MIEFKEFTGTDARQIDPQGIAWPDDAVVVYGMEDGAIVCRSSVINLPVIEGTMLADEKQGGTLGVRLVRRIEDLYRQASRTHAMAFAVEGSEVGGYLERLGYKRQPLEFYAKELT